MVLIQAILKHAPEMCIEELERHIRERAEECDKLRSEQAQIVPHLDRAWAIQQATQSKPGSGQSINIGGISIG